MKLFAAQHQELLDALRGELLIPKLYRRLSLERYVASETEVRKMRDWPQALDDDPGWALLAPVLDNLEAWPQAFEEARARGFSPRAEHHHALLFWRLGDRFIADGDVEGANYALGHCIRAWRAVLTSDYATELLHQLAEAVDQAPEQAPTRYEEVLRELLLPLAEQRYTICVEALTLDDDSRDPQVDRRILRMAFGQLETLQEELHQQALEDEVFGSLRALKARTGELRQELSLRVADRFDRAVDALDMGNDPLPAILLPFSWVGQAFEVLDRDSDFVMGKILERVVETGWTLRKTKRDENDSFLHQILDQTDPIFEALARRIERGKGGLGYNSICADFLVFRGEKMKDLTRRRPLFERGVKLCPGHRNCSMLLSYELTYEARMALKQSGLQPRLAGALGLGQDKNEERLHKVLDLMDEALQLYAFNKDIDDLQTELRAEAKRLGIALPEDRMVDPPKKD